MNCLFASYFISADRKTVILAVRLYTLKFSLVLCLYYTASGGAISDPTTIPLAFDFKPGLALNSSS